MEERWVKTKEALLPPHLVYDQPVGFLESFSLRAVVLADVLIVQGVLG